MRVKVGVQVGDGVGESSEGVVEAGDVNACQVGEEVGVKVGVGVVWKWKWKWHVAWCSLGQRERKASKEQANRGQGNDNPQEHLP